MVAFLLKSKISKQKINHIPSAFTNQVLMSQIVNIYVGNSCESEK